MSILLTGLARGAYVYQKTYVNNVWRSLATVVDNGAGDLDMRPGVVRFAGAPNRTTYIQVDNNRRAGDEDTFYKATQNARGQLVSPLARNRMASLPVTQSTGMQRGATIDIYDATQSKLLARAGDNSSKDLDQSGNIKFSTLVAWDQTFVVHIRNPGAAKPIIRAFRNGKMVPVPPKPSSAAAVALANKIAAQIKADASRIALYLSQSALKNDDTMTKENLKNGIRNAGIQRAAVAADDRLRSLRVQTFRAKDGTVLKFADVLRIAGEAKTGWNANSAKVARFQRLRNEANAEAVNNAQQLVLSLKNQKIDKIIDTLPDAFSDLSNIGVQLNTERIKAALATYTNAVDDYAKIFGFAMQYSGRNFTADLAVGGAWQKEIETKFNQLTAKMTEVIKKYTDAVVIGLNAQKAAAARQKTLAALNIASLVAAFASAGIAGFASFAKFADKRYIWDAVAGGSNVIDAGDAAIKTAAQFRSGAQGALGVSVITGSPAIDGAVSRLGGEFREAEKRIAMAAPSLQTTEEFDNRRNPVPGFVDMPRDLTYIGYTEVQKSAREETGTWYWVERTYYQRWLL